MSSLQDRSTLASIVGSRPGWLAEFESSKLTAESLTDMLPTQLYTMFWGKSMADEEKKWRDAHPPMPVEGAGLGNECQGGDEPVDVDVSEEEESDDDIIQGCYSLEIDIEDFGFSRIWIRAEYIRIYDALEAYYRKPAFPKLAPAAVITGQPGIGKSIWIYYALRRRLAERKAVIWYLRGARYLFVEEGVYEVPVKFHDFEIFVWTLVDSDEDKDGVPKTLVMHNTRHFVIYCTSPRRDRWSRLHKTVRDQVFIMNPWKSEEILRVASWSTIPPDSVDSVFNELGPTPRLCIDYLSSGKIVQHRKDVQNIISKLKIDELAQLLQDSHSLTMDAVSQKIYLISREDREDACSSAIVSPITSSIKSRLANQFRTLERREQIRLYKLFSKVPESRKLSGILFEAVGQRRLQEGVNLVLLPMVRLPPSRQGKNKRQWYSSHVSLPNEKLEAIQPLTIPGGLDVEEYMDKCPSIKSNVIYVPASTNQVALDSFILMNDHLYVFQFSIASTHDIKTGFLNFLDECSGFSSLDKCYFVFIHPPGHTLVCPRKMRELHPWSATLDICLGYE